MKENKSGKLVLVATPIGNLDDLSPRAKVMIIISGVDCLR